MRNSISSGESSSYTRVSTADMGFSRLYKGMITLFDGYEDKRSDIDKLKGDLEQEAKDQQIDSTDGEPKVAQSSAPLRWRKFGVLSSEDLSSGREKDPAFLHGDSELITMPKVAHVGMMRVFKYGAITLLSDASVQSGSPSWTDTQIAKLLVEGDFEFSQPSINAAYTSQHAWDNSRLAGRHALVSYPNLQPGFEKVIDAAETLGHELVDIHTYVNCKSRIIEADSIVSGLLLPQSS